MRPALARYNMLSDSAKKKKFWKNKINEPVVLSQVQPYLAGQILQNRIYHNGFFQSTIDFDTIQIGGKRAKYLYQITLNDPYKIGSVVFKESQDDLNEKISISQENSLLKEGDLYSLETIKNERIRVDRFLKDRGYLYFNPEFIFLQADSISQDHMVNIRVLVKPETPPESRIPYSIGKIYVHEDYALDNYFPDTLDLDPYFFLSEKSDLKKEALMRGIFIKPGQLYSQTNHTQTVRYLNNLPIIKSTSIRYSTGKQQNQLNTTIYLTKRKQYAYTAEFNTVFRSTNYFGPGVVFSYTNRNAGRGAEQLKINLRGRFEIQIADGVVNPAYELGLEFNYRFPKLYPSFIENPETRKLPQTTISTGYNLFYRLDLYRLNSVFMNFGYRWSKNDEISHRYNPVEMIFTQVPESSISDEFRDYLEENPGVRRSFEEQFVLGTGYEFTYDPSPTGKSKFFFRGGLDLSGNLIYAALELSDAKKDSIGRYSLFGVPFSQYLRTRLDFRYRFNISSNSRLVTRFITGIGVPYGNSDILPYIKQFYVGGTNSLRSFIARSIGPGSEVPPEGFSDLTGDIQLEWNLEYRFTLSGNLKSALFLDMGNVWLFNKDPSRPGGVFRFDKFLDELAISSGWGLRWDFDFIVARLDFAYTLRTPYLPEGERWTKKLDIWDPTINIAIGYPF
jgi:outer membrane protein assembly factor BamA